MERLNFFLDRLVSATVVLQKGTLWIFKREYSDKLCMETWKVFKRENSSVQTLLICTYWLNGRVGWENICLKVIPLKLFYYQTFFETWRNEHSWYEHYKNAIKIRGHRACLGVSRLLKWGIFTGCALKVWITFIQN